MLTAEFWARHIRETVQALESQMREGWLCWAISNHDVERVASRWGGGDAAPSHLASLLSAMVCSLRGSVCVYQGEELGLAEAELPYELLQDPYGIAFWPTFKGRDGCRTPMPWTSANDGGFSPARPCLLIPESHRACNVEQQDADPASPLQRFSSFMRWRKQHPALMWGDVNMLVAPDPELALERELDVAQLRAWFNTGSEACVLDAADLDGFSVIEGHGLVGGELHGSRVQLPPHGVLFASHD